MAPSDNDEESIYIHEALPLITLSRPRTTDRIHEVWVAFQTMFRVGPRCINATVMGDWMDMGARKRLHIAYGEGVRMIGFTYKQGVTARWPDGSQRILRCTVDGEQHISFALATPDQEMHQHHNRSTGTTYWSPANECRLCKRLQAIILEEGNDNA